MADFVGCVPDFGNSQPETGMHMLNITVAARNDFPQTYLICHIRLFASLKVPTPTYVVVVGQPNLRTVGRLGSPYYG
jgi:hypothetical protein